MNPMTRREFVQTGAVAAGALASTASWGEEGNMRRPNLVFVWSDQQHGNACGFLDSFFETPHLDRLASEGVVFENAFCTTPQCSPSRSSMMTGLYPHKTGILGNMGAAWGMCRSSR